MKIVTLGKKRRVMKSKKVEEFFVDMQDDFQDCQSSETSNKTDDLELFILFLM